VCERTATLMAHWMRVGFVHGVMNTDNMSILGLTIDYGPYGWIDDYDPDWTPNTTDAHGRRYRFGHQPAVAHWNLVQLANALVPVFDSTEPLYAGIQRYVDAFTEADHASSAAKLGLARWDDGDDALIDELHALMHEAEVDMTLFFRGLADVDTEVDAPPVAPLEAAFYDAARQQAAMPQLRAWLARYVERVRRDGRARDERRARMNAVNPRYVLRNYLAQQAIDRAAQGDDAEVDLLLDVLRRPYDEQPGRERFAQRRPEWARNRPGCSMLSCSS
jgi:uncharacterized protein YdiU (UPF0061 family)